MNSEGKKRRRKPFTDKRRGSHPTGAASALVRKQCFSRKSRTLATVTLDTRSEVRPSFAPNAGDVNEHVVT